MITIEIFGLALLLVSVLTTLTVEAIKKLTTSTDYNIIAAVVAVILSGAVAVLYVLYTGTEVTTQIIVLSVVLVFLSFLCATVGYDKVIQALRQMKRNE